MDAHEIIIYRSPLEKMLAEYVLAHPGLLVAAYIFFGIFFLIVLALAVSVFVKVFRMSHDLGRRRNR